MALHQYKETKKMLDRDARKRKRCAQDCTILMNVSDDTGFLSPLSVDETPVISGEVAEFIEASAESVRPDDKLTLKIKSDCIDEAEKAQYKRAIEVYYTGKYLALGRELSKKRTVAILLAVAGVLVLGLALLLEYFAKPVWAEVIDIVAWVFLWEATDICFLASAKLRRDRQKYLSFITMDVVFEQSRVRQFEPA